MQNIDFFENPGRIILMMLVSLCFLAMCARAPKIQDYATLPPPDRVQAKIAGGYIEVIWERPELAAASRISSFKIYASQHSLMYTAFHELPEPAASVPATIHSAKLPFPAGTNAIFIHVRSSNSRGDLSLPSLPELRMSLGENGQSR